MLRKYLLFSLMMLGAAAWAAEEFAGDVIVYKLSSCGCCAKWVSHMRDHGFSVTEVEVEDVTPYKREHGVPAELSSCHTALVGDYVIEGHVPAADVKRLLEEKPPLAGLAVPGMPLGSPGMEAGGRMQPYDVLAFRPDASVYTYSSYNQQE